MNKYSYICLTVIDSLKKYISVELWFPLPLLFNYSLFAAWELYYWMYSAKTFVFENFAKFIGKQLCCSLSFDKILVCKSAYFTNMGLQHRCFPLNFPKFSTALLHVVWIDLFKAVVSRTTFPMKELNFSHNLLVARKFLKIP